MKNTLTLLAIASVGLSSAFAETAVPAGYGGPPEHLHIYLLIGQSNMSGRAQITDAEKAIPPRTALFNAENNWEPATHPFNQYSTIPRETHRIDRKLPRRP